jgi:transposase-like protein
MSDRRNAKAAKRFLSAVLKRSRELDPAGDQYRQEPGLPRGDRRVKKGRYAAERHPALGFQSMKTAYATIKGFEVMRMFKKGQFTAWIDAIGGGTEAHFINRLFGLYA